MSTAFQGFARSLNLSESATDRDVLNNLGGEPIADDILLFSNNLRNVSELNVQPSNISGSVISFNINTQKFVYTNGTEITVNGTTYYVGDSNGVNSFRLYSNENLSTLVTSPPTGFYKRSDAVSFSDLLRLSPVRDKVVENTGLSELTLAAGVTYDESIYDSMVAVFNAITTGYPTTLSAYFSSIEKNLSLFEFKKTKSINSVVDFISDNSISLAGNLIVKDPSGTNNTTVSTTTGPGIFILNTADNTAQRIFSNNENVWTDEGSYLGVNSNEIVVGNLVFENGMILLRKSSLPAITTETASTETYTHYVPVVVNGEEYNLLLK